MHISPGACWTNGFPTNNVCMYVAENVNVVTLGVAISHYFVSSSLLCSPLPCCCFIGWLLELWNCGVWVCMWTSAIFSWWHLCGDTQSGGEEECQQHLHHQEIGWWEPPGVVQVCSCESDFMNLDPLQSRRGISNCLYEMFLHTTHSEPPLMVFHYFTCCKRVPRAAALLKPLLPHSCL